MARHRRRRIAMKFEAPTPGEIAACLDELDVALSADDRSAYEALLAGLFAAYAAIDAAPDALPEPSGERRFWRPAAADNPHNAWHVRTQLRTRDEGPLAGLRVALKDNVMLAGVPMLNGSAVLEGFVAEVDATIVTRLLDAGAEIAGKAHCEDLCASAGSHTNITGPVHNPHRRGHSAGGSSSGSAALVACGDVELAIGGDQGGSIRVPSALCGTVGMKPTFGLVPYTGIASIETSIDHAGPITRDVRDNARMLEVLAGPDGIDPRQSGLRAPEGGYARDLDAGAGGVRVALLSEGFGQPNSMPAVDACVRGAAEVLALAGAEIEETSVPMHREGSIYTLPLLVEGMHHTLAHGDGYSAGIDLYAPAYMEKMRRWREQARRLSPLAVTLVLAGSLLERRYGRRYYGKAANWARRMRAAYDAVLAEADCLLLPTCPVTAPPLPDPSAGVLERFARATETSGNTQIFDATHHPALSVPCGMVDGLPVGMMLVGRHAEEALLYRIARAFEASSDWRSRSY
jgi:amidase